MRLLILPNRNIYLPQNETMQTYFLQVMVREIERAIITKLTDRLIKLPTT
jgi:hypothetical protein